MVGSAGHACSSGQAAFNCAAGQTGEDVPEVVICLQNDVTDLAELQHAHMQYLAQTQHHCLMSQSTREVRAIVEPVLQCIVDFTNSCRYVNGAILYETTVCTYIYMYL